MENAEKTIAAQFGKETAKAAIDFMMDAVDHSARVSLFRGLLNGDARTLEMIVERYQLKNRS